MKTLNAISNPPLQRNVFWSKKKSLQILEKMVGERLGECGGCGKFKYPKSVNFCSVIWQYMYNHWYEAKLNLFD